MKQFYTIILMAIFGSFANAQVGKVAGDNSGANNPPQSINTIPQFFEGFEGPVFPPAGWLVADNSMGTNPNWQFNQLPYLPYEGIHAAFISRNNIGSGNTSEEWLITPAIPITAGMALRFRGMTQFIGDLGTSYYVRISTVSQSDQSTFTNLASWTDVNFPNNYSPIELPLDAFAGQSIFIAFIRIYTQPAPPTTGNRWLIDNVSVGDVNLVNGIVSYSNGPDCGTDPIPSCNTHIQIHGASFDSNVYSHCDDGFYSFTSLETDFTVMPQLYIPAYFNVTPPSYNYNFTGFGNVAAANFCITPNGVHNDLEVVFAPAYIRSGMSAFTQLIYKNSGTETLSGTVTVNFPSNLMHVYFPGEADTPGPDSVSFDFTDLLPFETRVAFVHIDTNSSSDPNFPVNIGDILNLTTTITPIIGDETPANNVFNSAWVVFGPLDPNEMIVSEGAFITPDQLSDYLHYTIHFQNVGTAAATTVVVNDDIPENLDMSTFQPIGGSHPYTVAVDHRKLEFTFNNINLPPASLDEAASQGSITFKIKPSANVGIGSVIENKANIFFDSNFPIMTNTVTTTVAALGTKTFDNNTFSVYPNPTATILNIQMKENRVIDAIEISNNLGQVVLVQKNAAKTVDVSGLAPGMYFIKVTSDNRKSIQQFLKL